MQQRPSADSPAPRPRPSLPWRLRNLAARGYFALDRVQGHRRLRRDFVARHGYLPDLGAPRTHSEKVQARKLYDRCAIFPVLSDKIAARDYVDRVLGPGTADRLMVPILAVADRFEGLDPALKRRDIIVKASHASGWNQVVRAGSEADWAVARCRARHWLSRVFGVRYLEWAYRDLPPRLLVEPLLTDPPRGMAMDLKMFCYDGVIRFYMPEDNSGADAQFGVFDEDFAPAFTAWGEAAPSFVRPPDFAAMQAVACALSAGFDMLRVDFLLQRDRWYLGELTLYDGSGMVPYASYAEDLAAGRYWCLRPGGADRG
jgi:hypothetical protein